jgi:uncharacterized protein (TIGR03435 family)
MKNSVIETVTKFLESQINKPVVDETQLVGKCDLELPWYNENPEQIHNELKKLGLEIVDAKKLT